MKKTFNTTIEGTTAKVINSVETKEAAGTTKTGAGEVITSGNHMEDLF